MTEFKKIIAKLKSKEIKHNINQKEYSNKSKKEWLNWLN